MLTLFRDAFWISPYVFSCFVALEEKALTYQVKEISLGDGAQRKPEFANPSVTARVPALDHDGYVVAESSAIVEYLEDAFPEPRVLPVNIKQRARARQIMAWIRSDDTLAPRTAGNESRNLSRNPGVVTRVERPAPSGLDSVRRHTADSS